MNIDSPRIVVERAKRPPSPRNIQIYEAVRRQGRRQTDVAREYGVNQKRISQICQQIDRWQAWLVAAPDREAIAAEQRRQTLQQAYARSERILLIALRHAEQSGQDCARDTAWMKIAIRASNDVAQIGQKLGADSQPGALGREIDELLAKLVSPPAEREMQSPSQGNAKSSRSSKTSHSGGAGSCRGGAGKRDAKHCQDETFGKWEDENKAEMQSISHAEFLAREIGKRLLKLASANRSGAFRSLEAGDSSLPDEVRERRAAFLRSELQ